MSLEFIKDVIYGLKIDMGCPLTITVRSNQTTNYATGAKTAASRTFTIPLAIPLPENQRLQFLKAITTNRKEGAAQLKGRHFLIDKDDVPSGLILTAIDTFVTYKGINGKVVEVEDYERAYDITVTGLPGQLNL